jgi:hypothetical protein
MSKYIRIDLAKDRKQASKSHKIVSISKQTHKVVLIIFTTIKQNALLSQVSILLSFPVIT